MNRALITDPDMPAKARSGELASVIRCIGCNVCIEHYHAGAPIACAQNPRTGRERHLPRPARTSSPRRVVVVGGGPAGLAAAAAGGHDVVLYEATQRLGGQVALASAAPGHQELAETMLSNYRHLLGRANVRIELGVRAELAVIRDAGADCVVVATGARPYAGRAELAGVPVPSAWGVLAGARRPSRGGVAGSGGGH